MDVEIEEEVGSNVVNEINQNWWVDRINAQLKYDRNPENFLDLRLLTDKHRKSRIRPLDFQEERGNFVYTPCIVSFGIYHINDEACQIANGAKDLVLNLYFKDSDMELDAFVNDLREHDKELKRAYSRLDPVWEQNEAFLKVMLFDGCFLLWMLHEAESWDAGNQPDPLSYMLLVRHKISLDKLKELLRHDILMFGNQLPMLVLEKLFALRKRSWFKSADLHDMLLKFIFPGSKIIPKRIVQHFYVLDLCYNSLLSSNNSYPEIPGKAFLLKNTVTFILKYMPGLQGEGATISNGSRNDLFRIPSVTELDKVGIQFQTSKTTSFLDISFGRRDLRLPQIFVDGETKSMFATMKHFETCSVDNSKNMSSYIYFMSRLLRSEDDVKHLQSRGIIHGPLLASEVADLFDIMIKEFVQYQVELLSAEHYPVARRLAESFYYKMNNPLQKDLWQNYLKSPLAIISVIAAFFLFSLTIIQTVYTVLGYYNPK